MSTHNFNFPTITISSKSFEPKAIIGTFTKINDDFSSSFSIPNEVKENLSEENLSVLFNGVYYSLIFLKEKDKKIEEKISEAIYKLPKSLTKIEVYTDFSNIKKLVSSILIKNANHWTAKSEEVKLIDKFINIVTDVNDTQNQLEKGRALAEAICNKMRLIEMPSNYLTPIKMYSEVKYLLSNDKVTIKEVHGRELKQEGYGALYAVSKGSENDGYLITIKYNGGEDDEKPIVLVGKGLTFDSGGISIKPSKGMGRMKGDMGGAATVISSILYAIKTGVKKNIVGIIATCENMPDGKSLKPGDVITAKNGKTIEVEDTDAEGRLVLADALCLAQTFNGSLTIDFATLTGACISALGHVHTGLFTENDSIAEQLTKLGFTSGDTVWRLPLSDDYKHFLDSEVADINNLCLGQGAGATNGAVFLREFAPKENWVHLDIAGTSDFNGATGRPVTLISELLDN